MSGEGANTTHLIETPFLDSALWCLLMLEICTMQLCARDNSDVLGVSDDDVLS